MRAVIAIFYGLITWLAAALYALIAWPEYFGAAIVFGPFITSGMSIALLALDGLVTFCSSLVARFLPKREGRAGQGTDKAQ